MSPDPAEPTEISRVEDGLWRVPLVTPTLPPATRTNVYVWNAAGRLWIVDPGASKRSELKRLTDLVETGGAWPELVDLPIGGYLVTHHHPDHWGGLSRLLAWRRAPVVAAEPKRYRGIDAPWRSPAWLNDELGYQATVMTPGHASDHVVVRIRDAEPSPEGGASDVLAGDLVAGVGTVVINPPDGDMADYLASLETLSKLGVGRLFPAHGPTVDDGAALLREYTEHRLMRERQVIDALGAKATSSPSGLVPSIYPDLALILRPVAARSVLAHLLKLERDGRVERAGALGRKWRLV